MWIWLHRYIGLVTFLFLGFASITACALCFVGPLDKTLNADLFYGPVAENPVAVARLVDRFQASHRRLRVRSFPLSVPADERIPVLIEAVGGATKLDVDQVFLDRTTGTFQGARLSKAAWDRRGAAALLHDIHYTLLAGSWGRWAMGVVALAWLLSNGVGVYLTFPRRTPFWNSWARMWRFSLKSRLPRLMLDLHRASGLWLILPLTALAATSIALNFFAEAYEPTIKHFVPPAPTVFDRPAPFPVGVDGKIGFTRALAIITAQAAAHGEPGEPATALYFPDRKLYGAALTDDGALNYKRLGPVYYYVDADNGRLADIDSPYLGDTGLALVRILYPLHSGRLGGVVGVAVVFVLGLATLEMCVTGVFVWWRKRSIRMAARRRPPLA